MSPELQLLIQLQELDSNLDRVRHRIAEIPLAQEALDARVAERTGAVSAVKERIAVSQGAQARDREGAGGHPDAAVQVQGTADGSQDEQGIPGHAERDGRRRDRDPGHEDRMLDQMEEAEGLATELKAAEAALKAEQADIAREQQALATERKALDDELQQHSAARQSVVRRSPARP